MPALNTTHPYKQIAAVLFCIYRFCAEESCQRLLPGNRCQMMDICFRSSLVCVQHWDLTLVIQKMLCVKCCSVNGCVSHRLFWDHWVNSVIREGHCLSWLLNEYICVFLYCACYVIIECVFYKNNRKWRWKSGENSIYSAHFQLNLRKSAT